MTRPERSGGEAERQDRGGDADLLERIEEHFDAAPRAAADVEEHGALTLFVSRIPWRFYGRPRLGLGEDVGADDVAAVRARQRELGVREAFEWVHETTPSLAGAAAAAGLEVLQVPLLALDADGVGAAARARRRAAAHARRRRRRRCPPRRRSSSSRSRRRAWSSATPAPRRATSPQARLGDLGFLRERIRARPDRDGRRRERGRRAAGRRLAPARRRRLRGDGHRHAAVGAPPRHRRGGHRPAGRRTRASAARRSSSSRPPATTSRACTSGSASAASARPASPSRATRDERSGRARGGARARRSRSRER